MFGLEVTVLLRALHILGGIFWVGGALVSVGFLVPAVRASGPEGMKVMRQLMGPQKLSIYMNIAGVVSILSGFWLYTRNVHLSNGAWASSTSGMIFGFGGLCAVLSAVFGAAFVGPLGRKLAAESQRPEQRLEPGSSSVPAPPPERIATMERLGNRMRRYAQINAGLLVLAALSMAIARYL